MFYFVKTPLFFKWIFRGCVWNLQNEDKSIYLSFDDGPHPEVTSLVLDILKEYNAKATFFCIGKNVAAYPSVYQRIIDEGHAVGNHTYNHLNGWKTEDEEYLNDVYEAQKFIDSDLFRPPYGRISNFKIKLLSKLRYRMKIIMWTVLSGDFDPQISKETCCDNVILNTKSGSIVVFHDSEKAKEKMLYTLPLVLSHFKAKGFNFKKVKIER